MVDDGDEFVVFQNVTIVRSTAPALLCTIAGREMWLPRMHVAGKLWCAGDRGKLLVRRWVARDRQLIAPVAPGPLRSVPGTSGEGH
jgi:hypothetical protein